MYHPPSRPSPQDRKQKRHSNRGPLARQKFQKLTESPKRPQKDSNPPFKTKHHPGRSTYTDRFAGEWASASRDGSMVENSGRGSRTMPPDPETIMQLRRRDPGSNSDQASSPKGHPSRTVGSSSVHNQHGALLCSDAELTRCFVVEGSLAGVVRVKHLVIDRQPPVVCCLQTVRLYQDRQVFRRSNKKVSQQLTIFPATLWFLPAIILPISAAVLVLHFTNRSSLAGKHESKAHVVRRTPTAESVTSPVAPIPAYQCLLSSLQNKNLCCVAHGQPHDP
ncbi:hypothetical protein LX32DRAFT_238534 [Colletotrichum zoysiae]|uniref:Uncharacterized protein n=1 Tax=Colletotrichum zoysiae TaxID=1216348 RepID=A0AAD9H3T2_9PEZI|nr:hypothetical protein LX32DRAFT_238534 [Colletotrichum zoysiae]